MLADAAGWLCIGRPWPRGDASASPFPHGPHRTQRCGIAPSWPLHYHFMAVALSLFVCVLYPCPHQSQHQSYQHKLPLHPHHAPSSWPPPPHAIRCTHILTDPNIIVMLSSTVLETATLPLNESLRPLLSPALMESALWAASRWGATYLCPEEPLPRALEGSFGRPGQGPALVERLLQSALLCLTGFPAEAALQGVVASQLLPMLVRHRALCQLLVDGSAAWQALAAAAGSHSLSGCGLAPAAHRALLQHVALAAQGCADKDRANQYTSQVGCCCWVAAAGFALTTMQEEMARSYWMLHMHTHTHHTHTTHTHTHTHSCMSGHSLS